MNLKTVVDSIVEALKEKGINEESISQILHEWQLRENIEDLELEEYDREKIRSLFDIIEAHLRMKEVEEETLEISDRETIEIEEEPVEEEALEKELEELVKLLTSEEDQEEAEEERLRTEEPESEIEKELKDFAEFLRKTQESLIEEKPITIQEDIEEPRPISILEKEEEQKLKNLVEELVEETRGARVEYETPTDIDIKGLRMAAVIEENRVKKLLIFRKPEEEPNIPALIGTIRRLWELTGYEIHDMDSFHLKSGAVILYVEKIEGVYYLAVVESETVGGAKFIAHALKRLIK